jgi:predicted kinase
MLIILGELPGTGKTTVARGVARAMGAIHLRIDSSERALRGAGSPIWPIMATASRAPSPRGPEQRGPV